MSEDDHGVTEAGVGWVATRDARWCVECIARVDGTVTDPHEQEAMFEAVPDDDGVLHARLREPQEAQP